jgi:hypothetical protein
MEGNGINNREIGIRAQIIGALRQLNTPEKIDSFFDKMDPALAQECKGILLRLAEYVKLEER